MVQSLITFSSFLPMTTCFPGPLHGLSALMDSRPEIGFTFGAAIAPGF